MEPGGTAAVDQQIIRSCSQISRYREGAHGRKLATVEECGIVRGAAACPEMSRQHLRLRQMRQARWQVTMSVVIVGRDVGALVSARSELRESTDHELSRQHVAVSQTQLHFTSDINVQDLRGI